MNTTPHPELTSLLFTGRRHMTSAFNDIAGINKLHHLAITRIDKNGHIVIFSSTPAIEFHLFESGLWRFDNTYHSDWFSKMDCSNWPSLYEAEHQEELYYQKQSKHHLLTTLSMSFSEQDCFFIYSMASQAADKETQDLFSNNQDEFYKIGRYCHKKMNDLYNTIL